MPVICIVCQALIAFLYVYIYRVGAIDILLLGNCGATRLIIPSPNIESFHEAESGLGKTHTFDIDPSVAIFF